MKVISLDLEMNQPSGRIIQIGAVIGDVETCEIHGRFSKFIVLEEPLNPEITKLTGITERDLEYGASLPQAYSELVQFFESHGPFCNPITWGGSDSLDLRAQLDGAYTKWIFGRRWVDAKTIYQTYCMANRKPLQGGLAKVMTKFGLRFIGRKHNALCDAENTFVLYCHFLKMFRATSNSE